jgi:hypothetical protein
MTQTLEQQLQSILDRNARVEREKAWEVSWTRRLSIAVLTYVVAVLFLWSIGIPVPYLQAFVPTLGYLLSTVSIPWVKRWWMDNQSPNPKHQ